MDKEEVKSYINQIEVPQDAAFNAINKGIYRAIRTKTKRYSLKKKIQISSITAVSILGITLGSGFFNSSMNQVLAETPLIGQIYKDFGDSIGFTLAQQDLITELNQSQTIDGVTVKLTSAYFDGSVVSIIGHVSGDIDWGGNEQDEVSFDVSFENNKGDHDPWLGMTKQIKKNGDGFDFHWTLTYPYEDITEDFTLPVTIHYINGSKGDWNFDIPIKQKKYQTMSLQHSESYPNDRVQIKIKDIKSAQASSSLVFETISNNERDRIDLNKAVDNMGNELFNQTNNDTELSRFSETNHFHVINRKMMEKLDSKATSITFYPEVEIADSPVHQLLNKSSFTLRSERTDLKIKVNKITSDDNQLMVDYEFNGLPKEFSNHEFEILTHNLSYDFTLIDQDYLSQIALDNPSPPANHSITRNEVKVLNKANYHFQSIFNLNGEEKLENFNINNTVLQYDFNGSIGLKELKPFTIELPNK